ncbi:MAG TPA: hypothetical protein VKA36_10065 [Solirubrobacterales bacterium]|nr:hypothetical protein [Solirubrobacterales bacterium]
MKLYVCWDTRPKHPIIGKHPCGIAHEALVEAGHDPEVVKARGWAALPEFLNSSKGRREVRELSGGNDEVPALVLDSGEFIQGTHEIVDWAKANPAAGATPAGG